MPNSLSDWYDYFAGKHNAKYDPKQPRGVQNGYYRMQNGIVKVRDGKVVGFVAQGR